MPCQRWVLCGTLSLCLIAPALAVAQAWLPPKGEGYASVSYQRIFNRYHTDRFGRKSEGGRIYSHVALLGVTYALTDRLAVSADIPYITARYSGNTPHRTLAGRIILDDGSYHGVFTEFRVDLRYNAVREPLAVTPFFASVIPSHIYNTHGHANPGRALREYHVGVNLGRQLRPFLPRAYVDLRYAYVFVQKLFDLNINRSYAGVELGYFLAPSVAVWGSTSWLKTHGLGDESPVVPPDVFDFHDRLIKAHYVRVGGGATFSVRPNLDLHASFTTSVFGRRSDLITGIGVGVSWNFSRRREETAAVPSRNASRPREQTYRKLAALSAKGFSRLASAVPSIHSE